MKSSNLFNSDKTNIKLPLLGNVAIDKTNKANYEYESIIEEFLLGDNNFQINIYFKDIDKHAIECISRTLIDLEKIRDITIQAYLVEYNNENSREYIDGIYKKILTENEYSQLVQNSTKEERLLSAFRIANIEFYVKTEDIYIVLHYIFGYELKFIFELNESYRIKELKFEPGSFLCKKQLFDFTDKWEKSDGWEKCTRFKSDWWNYPILSYYIYHMGKRIEKYLLNK